MLKKYHHELSNMYEEIIIKRRAPLEVFDESPLSEEMKLTDIAYFLGEYIRKQELAHSF
jgi:hypothetical protein